MMNAAGRNEAKTIFCPGTYNGTIDIAINQGLLFSESQPSPHQDPCLPISNESVTSCESLVSKASLLALNDFAKTTPVAKIENVGSHPIYLHGSSSNGTPLCNPYSKSSKRQRDMLDSETRPNIPSAHVGYMEDLIPHSFDSFDRFFAILLRSSAFEYITSGRDEISTFEHWKVTGGSSRNIKEAEVICDLVNQLALLGFETSIADRIRIITFYHGQVALLKKLLTKKCQKVAEVGTVDASQGCEADIVILSLVRTASPGFLCDVRRLNVALTRARHQMICVGSVDRLGNMNNAEALCKLSRDARLRNVILESDF